MAGENFTAGLDIDDKRQLLYVVTKEDNSLYILDLVKDQCYSDRAGRGGLYLSALP